MKKNFTLAVGQDTLLKGLSGNQTQTIFVVFGVMPWNGGTHQTDDAFAKFLTSEKWVVVGYDQRGHGKL
jgi:hypothetical protein